MLNQSVTFINLNEVICVFNQTENDTIIRNDPTICYEQPPQFTNETLIRVCVLSFMAVISFVGNIATIWNIRKTRLFRRMTRHNCSAVYQLLLHLSIADILVTGFGIAGDAVWNYTVEWIAGDIMCKIYKFFQMFSLYLSTYVLVLIGIDRWIAVKYPMKSLNTSRRCNRLLIAAYLLSLFLSIPQCFIFRLARGPFIEDFYQCHTDGFYTAKWQEQTYTTFTLVFMFIIPLFIIIITYMSTFRTISGSAQVFNLGPSSGNLENGNDTTRRRLIHKAKKKSAQISLVIVIAFVVCWTPYYSMMLIFMFWNPDKTLADTLQTTIFFFGSFNSLINPLIYGAFHFCPLKKRGFGSKSSTRRDPSTIQQTVSTNGTPLYRQQSSKYIPLNQLTPKNSINKG